MSNLGPKWEDNEDYSPARMDAKTILRDTGANIVAMASTRQLGAVCPTDTSAGLIKDVLYISQYDGFLSRTAFIPVFGKHTHATSSSVDGGSLMNMYQANTANVIQIDMFHINLADWKQNIVGTGSFTYDEGSTSGRLKQDTGATINSSITGSIGGGRVSFSDIISWQIKAELSVGTNLLVRCGLNVDRVDETQNTARRQLGIEGCDGHGVNWVIINGNGTSASLHVQATTSPLINAPTGQKSYKLINTPSNECRLYADGVSTGVSTVNVAFDSNSDGLRLTRLGIKCVSAASHVLYTALLKLLANPGTNDLF